MNTNPEILHCVLEYEEGEEVDRVWLVGVFPEGHPLPPVTPGRTRNVCGAFKGVVMHPKAGGMRVFKINQKE